MVKCKRLARSPQTGRVTNTVRRSLDTKLLKLCLFILDRYNRVWTTRNPLSPTNALCRSIQSCVVRLKTILHAILTRPTHPRPHDPSTRHSSSSTITIPTTHSKRRITAIARQCHTRRIHARSDSRRKLRPSRSKRKLLTVLIMLDAQPLPMSIRLVRTALHRTAVSPAVRSAFEGLGQTSSVSKLTAVSYAEGVAGQRCAVHQASGILAYVGTCVDAASVSRTCF